VVLCLVLLAALAVRPGAQQSQPTAKVVTTQDNLGYVLTLFEQYLDSFRQNAGIPGLSGAIVSNGQIIWEKGQGYQDVENLVRATPDTPYLIGDLTQTFASTLMLQCAELDVDLDAPISRYADGVPDPEATVRHVLAHTTDSPPGATFRYDAGRYVTLTSAVERCFGRQYRVRLAASVLEQLAMIDSVPGTDLIDRNAVAPETFSDARLDRYQATLRRMAKPYRVVDRRRPVLNSINPAPVSSAGGLVSTVRDLAKFSRGLDDHIVLSSGSLGLAWNNAVTPGGVPHPMGLGWFVQRYYGERLVWHFGKNTDAYSSLLLKVPGRDLTLILLANSDGLSSSFGLSNGDVTTSVFAKLFLNLFVP
jgi:CubicO group peptidase (beta-lactamase class C family)